jgi:hypothetical protein
VISFGFNSTLTSALSVFSSAASVVTVIDSDRSPISSFAFTRRMLPPVTGMAVWVNVLKPCSAARSVYVPGRTFRTVYAPCSSETASSARPVVSLVSVMLTPGMAPPESSVTVPVTLPYNACAESEAGNSHVATASRTPSRHRRVVRVMGFMMDCLRRSSRVGRPGEPEP